MFIKTEKISGVNSKNSVADSKYRGLLDQTSKVTLIFENVGSKVYSVGRILHWVFLYHFPCSDGVLEC